MTAASLQPTVRPEDARLHFDKFGVALHFVAIPMRSAEDTEAEQLRSPFASFEEDLFSYAYAAGRGESAPFVSQIVHTPSAPETVWLILPRPIEYESEGRAIRLCSDSPIPQDGRRRQLAIRASRTDFQSGVSVFHLVFVRATAQGSDPDAGTLNEYDLIMLSKLWQGGEGWNAAEKVRFAWDGTPEASVRELARAVFDLPLVPPDEPQALRLHPPVPVGTIQLITSELSPVLALLRDRKPIEPRLEEAKGLGGILQGLLDFKEIDPQELTDVFAMPKIDGSSFLGMHKGTLLCVMESDRAHETVASTIGVSPYLLLPQALLLHNEAMLKCAETWSQMAPDNDNPSKLEPCINGMLDSLSSYLPNVFHYPHERWLFLKGETSRGLRTRQKELNEKRENLYVRWQQKVARRASFADDFRTSLLVWLALLPIYPEVKDNFWLKVVAFGSLFLIAAGTLLLPRRSLILKAIGGVIHRKSEARKTAEPTVRGEASPS
jgi:hypothetical protein